MEGSVNANVDEVVQATEPLLRGVGEPRNAVLYGRRWWVCSVFAAIAFMQGLGWNTYAPISASYKAVYGWDDASIALLPNVQGIVVLVLAIPFAAFQHKLDLRAAVLFTSTFSAICLGVRCVPCHRPAHFGWSMASMVANGISNSVNAVFPTAMSATWFPPEERTLATAIMAMGNFMGNALGFILGPLIVPEGSTDIADIERLYYYEAVAMAAVWLATIAYFPAGPPTPPSLSRSVENPAFFDGLAQLARSGRFWVIALAFGIPEGVGSGWLAMLGPNMQARHFSQDAAGWVGFAMTVAGCVAGIGAGQLLDVPRLARQKKTMVIVLFALCAVAAAVFALGCAGLVPAPRALMFASAGLAGAVINAVPPVFYELCLEETFPISESSSTSVLIVVQNLGQTAFLFMPISRWGTGYMNWVFAGTMVLAPIVLLPFKTRYRRLDVDLGGGAPATT